MLLTIEGTYEKGKIKLKELPKGVEDVSKVIITFLPKNVESQPIKKRQLGVWEGKYRIPENFNEPLEDLKDYM